MDGYVSLIKTKSFWIGALGVLVQIAAFFKIDLGIDPNVVSDVIVQVISGVLFLGAIVARQVATKQVAGVVAVTPAAIVKAEERKAS